jgi:hypothetical protein
VDDIAGRLRESALDKPELLGPCRSGARADVTEARTQKSRANRRWAAGLRRDDPLGITPQG